MLNQPVFKHPCGVKVKDLVTGLTGVIARRSDCLYGCNRYLIQPPAVKGREVPDAWWVDEDQVKVTGNGVSAKATCQASPIFEHPMGAKVKDLITNLEGIVTSRSDGLSCQNQYFIQPPANPDQKVPAGNWVNEGELVVTGKGVQPKAPQPSTRTGGPMSRVR